ncbi:MAG: response regulator [Elusimicrobiaceae bacterium]|nr:response regulator [Elusimicrobiaceae bacterium]
MKKKILIIEDEPAIIELLHLVLAREGYEVHTCQSGRDAIAAIKQVGPHLIILDVMLPGLDGASIVRIMHEDEFLSSIPVIVTSALLESERMFTPYPQVKGFCAKPFVLKDFIIKVKQAIGDE